MKHLLGYGGLHIFGWTCFPPLFCTILANLIPSHVCLLDIHKGYLCCELLSKWVFILWHYFYKSILCLDAHTPINEVNVEQWIKNNQVIVNPKVGNDNKKRTKRLLLNLIQWVGEIMSNNESTKVHFHLVLFYLTTMLTIYLMHLKKSTTLVL